MSNIQPPKRVNVQRRLDCTFEVIATDDATRMATVKMIPDPRRYDTVMVDGKSWYRDKYLREPVSLDEFAQQMGGLPIYHLAPTIESAPRYAAARKEALDRELATGEYSPPAEKAIPHRPLEENLQPRSLAFISADICGATAMRAADQKAFDDAHRLFMQELGTVVGQFNGALMKTTGDGFIAFVDHPSFTSLCDATVDLGLSLLLVLHQSVNPALLGAGLPPLKIRVGADCGEVQFRSIKVPATGFSAPEVASDALNRAVKIQETCEPGQLRIGRGLYELVHVGWLERATEVAFAGESVGVPGYRVYAVT